MTARSQERVNLADVLLVRYLVARDGPLGSRWHPHSEAGECRYKEHYEENACPWCEGERRRAQDGRRLRLTA